MSAEHVATALSQLHYVGSSAFYLFEEALAGREVSDDQIDLAFATPLPEREPPHPSSPVNMRDGRRANREAWR